MATGYLVHLSTGPFVHSLFHKHKLSTNGVPAGYWGYREKWLPAVSLWINRGLTPA